MRGRARVAIAVAAGSAAAVLVVRSEVGRAWANLRRAVRHEPWRPPAGHVEAKPAPHAE